MDWLLGALILVGIGIRDSMGWMATSHCVQLGQANFNANCKTTGSNTCPFNEWSLINYVIGYSTIGTLKFASTHYFLDASMITQAREKISLAEFDPPTNQTCPYKLNLPLMFSVHVDLCPDDNLVEIRAYAVKQNGVSMNGWLHFEVELMDKTDEIYGIYIQVRDEWFNAIGEFVSKPGETCESASTDLVMPTQYQVLPCSAIGYREAKVSDALYLVDPIMLQNRSAGEPYLTSRNLSQSRGIHFTWRLSEYWCNRHLRFRPEAMVFTKKMYTHNTYRFGSPKVYRKAAAYWLLHKWYGSADIKLDGTTLTCDEKVIDYNKTAVNKSTTLEKNPDGTVVAPWLHEMAEQSTLDNDYVAKANTYLDDDPITFNQFQHTIFSLQSCHANTRHKWSDQPSFSGRCKHHFEKYPSHDALQGCNLDVNAPEFKDLPQDLPTYGEYVHILTVNRTRQCSTPCKVPADMADLIAIQQYNTSFRPNKKPQVLKFTNIGATRHVSKVQKFWAGRKFHGQVLTFFSMFLIPVGAFASRYLKETAMKDVCIGCHLWFWIHMATLLLGGGLLGCGYLALQDLIKTFGRSLNEFSGFHRILSVSSIVIFLLMGVLGVFRTTSIAVRHVLLFLHSVLGFLVYFLNLAAMVISTWIPASPSMPGDCNPADGSPIGLSGVAIVTLVWLVLDIKCHVGMTILQIMVDRKYGVRRTGCYCPIIPFLPPESIKDFPGKRFRKIIFLVYILVSLAFTMTVIFMLSGDGVPEMCKNNTGPSTCTDPWGCSNWAQAYSKRYTPTTTKAPQAAN